MYVPFWTPKDKWLPSKEEISPSAEGLAGHTGDTWEDSVLFMGTMSYPPKQPSSSNLSQYCEILSFNLQYEGTKLSMDPSGIQSWYEVYPQTCQQMLQGVGSARFVSDDRSVKCNRCSHFIFKPGEGESNLSWGDLPKSYCPSLEIIIAMERLTTKPFLEPWLDTALWHKPSPSPL